MMSDEHVTEFERQFKQKRDAALAALQDLDQAAWKAGIRYQVHITPQHQFGYWFSRYKYDITAEWVTPIR